MCDRRLNFGALTQELGVEFTQPYAAELESLYERMLRIRLLEDAVHRLFLNNEIEGTTHLYQGQAGVAVGYRKVFFGIEVTVAGLAGFLAAAEPHLPPGPAPVVFAFGECFQGPVQGALVADLARPGGVLPVEDPAQDEAGLEHHRAAVPLVGIRALHDRPDPGLDVRPAPEVRAGELPRGRRALPLRLARRGARDDAAHHGAPARGAREVRHLVAAGGRRERLGLAGEQVMPVDVLTRDAARVLFVERARAAQPDFHAGDGDPALDGILESLDHLPVAIEMAAARVSAIGLADPEKIGSGEQLPGCLLVVGYEGPAAAVAGQRDGVAAVLVDAGGERLGNHPG